MSIGTDAETKKKIIAEYATTEGDTGSPEVQIALLSHRIATSPSTSRAQARPPQPSWPAAARRPAPPAAELPAARPTSSATARSSSVSACAADLPERTRLGAGPPLTFST